MLDVLMVDLLWLAEDVVGELGDDLDNDGLVVVKDKVLLVHLVDYPLARQHLGLRMWVLTTWSSCPPCGAVRRSVAGGRELVAAHAAKDWAGVDDRG